MTYRSPSSSVVGMTVDRKARDRATNAHFMAVLKGAIKEAGLTYAEVDERLGLSEGMTSRWIRNAQIMRAPMFVSIAATVGADPEELMTRAMRKIKADGLLADVEVLPSDVEVEQAGQ